MSWATDADDVSVSPATTARMVANATAAMSASSTAPPVDPAPPPTASASSGEARLPLLVATSAALSPFSSAAAPKPRTSVNR